METWCEQRQMHPFEMLSETFLRFELVVVVGSIFPA